MKIFLDTIITMAAVGGVIAAKYAYFVVHFSG